MLSKFRLNVAALATLGARSAAATAAEAGPHTISFKFSFWRAPKVQIEGDLRYNLLPHAICFWTPILCFLLLFLRR